MNDDLKMVISRGKVTFSRTTSTRCSVWVLRADQDVDEIVATLKDFLKEVSPDVLGVPASAMDAVTQRYVDMSLSQHSEVPVSDGVAFQPPKHTTLGGIVDLTTSE